MLRRGWLLGVLLSLAALGLAAQCRPLSRSGEPAGPPLPASPPGPVIRVALLTPMTSELATFGRVMRNGMLLAFDEWNRQGGLLDRRIEWAMLDTDCNFETAGRVTQQAIDEGFEFIIGPLCSEAAIAAASVAEAEKVVLLAPAATHPLVTVDGAGQTRPTIFRVSDAYPLQGQAAARFARETLGADKAALFSNPGDDYAAGLSQAFAEQFARQGGEIVYQASFMANEADLAETLRLMQTAGAAVIYLPAPPVVVNRIAGQWQELGLSAALLGSDSWESAELDLTATAGSYFTTHFVLEDQQTARQTWVAAYQSVYAVAPNTLAALSYDAANILAQAIQQAGTLEVTSVAQTLAGGRFDGVTGQLTFDSQHNPLKPVPVVQIKAERIVFTTYVNMQDRAE